MRFKTEFSSQRLYSNALIATITQAIWRLRSEVNLIEHSWDKGNYNVSDTSGAFGTITFSNNELVGVFFSTKDSENPFNNKGNSSYNYRQFLQDIPSSILILAERECLQYMLQELNGETQPVVTSIIWNDKELIYTNQKLEKASTNGLFLIQNYSLDTANSFKFWSKYFNLKFNEYSIAEEIYSAKLESPYNKISLDERIVSTINQSASKKNNIEECQKILSSINIFFCVPPNKL